MERTIKPTTSPRGAGWKSLPAVKVREPGLRLGPIRCNSGTDGHSPDESEGAVASRAACPVHTREQR